METAPVPPPFGEYTVKLLLLGPGRAGTQPRNAATRADMKQAWGMHGERCGPAWRLHEAWLRQVAEARGIRPTFRGRFFAEALAREGTTR